MCVSETEASLLMSGQPALQESEPNPAESSVSSAGERTLVPPQSHIIVILFMLCSCVCIFLSEGLSGVELSDLTLNTEPLTHLVRGLSRRKPKRAFSVSAFEKQFDQLPGAYTPVIFVSKTVCVWNCIQAKCICIVMSAHNLSRSKCHSSNSFPIFSHNTEDISHVSHKGDVSQEKGDASQDLDLSSGSKR